MAKRGGFPGGMPGNMNNLMKQAQRMQRQMEETTKELEDKGIHGCIRRRCGQCDRVRQKRSGICQAVSRKWWTRMISRC